MKENKLFDLIEEAYFKIKKESEDTVILLDQIKPFQDLYEQACEIVMNEKNFTGLYDVNQNRVHEYDLLEITWPDGEITCEQVTYDRNFAYYRYGNNPLCEIIEDDRISFKVLPKILENN